MRSIWFFGPTACGKRTKLFWLADIVNRRHESARALGLRPHDLVLPAVIPNPIRGKRGEEYQRILARRIDLLTEIYTARIEAVWLIHGQRIDIDEDVPGRILEATGAELPLAVYLKPDKRTYEMYAAARGVEIRYEYAFAETDAELRYLSARFLEVRVLE